MKKITETAKELGITFCQDCGLYSRELCNKFNFPADPGDLTCPHFVPITNHDKFKREIEDIASACGFIVRYEDECEEALNITFVKARD